METVNDNDRQSSSVGTSEPPRRERARRTSDDHRFSVAATRRSNAHIADAIDAILAGNSDDVDASDVHGYVEDGEVTLEGTVDDARQKWRIEELCSSIDGVHDVMNHIRVVR